MILQTFQISIHLSTQLTLKMFVLLVSNGSEPNKSVLPFVRPLLLLEVEMVRRVAAALGGGATNNFKKKLVNK